MQPRERPLAKIVISFTEIKYKAELETLHQKLQLKTFPLRGTKNSSLWELQDYIYFIHNELFL